MKSPVAKKQRILFLCTGNSARSVMAEVLINQSMNEKFEAFSAGTHPEGIDPRTLNALKKHNFSVDGLKSQDVSLYQNDVFDYVITLCDKANQECREFSGALNQLSWDCPDPKARLGLDPFMAALNDLNRRLSMFVSLEGKYASGLSDSADQLSIEPVTFFKCLTDDIRLKVLLLTHYHGELCVCELMEALQEDSQPKVSRNLAILKKAAIISDRKNGQWVFYRINPNLPLWVKTIIGQTAENNVSLIAELIDRLAMMKNRPSKVNYCQ